MNDELTKEQTERQDLVDNAILDMLRIIDPTETVDWGVSGVDRALADIRDIVQELFKEKGVCTEMEFYPHLKERT